MNIVVLLKAVPVVGTERLDSDLLTDRSGASEANGNDEYLLEKALKLTEAHGGSKRDQRARLFAAIDAARNKARNPLP